MYHFILSIIHPHPMKHMHKITMHVSCTKWSTQNFSSPTDHAPSGTLQTRENFKGCLRNVIIGGERRDWTDMAALHNILLSSCPLPG